MFRLTRLVAFAGALLIAATVLAEDAKPAGQTKPAKGPVKVFLLSGQSNMTGRGTLGNLNKPAADQKATLVRYIKAPENAAKYKFLYAGPNKTSDGWTIRDDVFITVGDWPHLKPGEQGYSTYKKHGGLAPHYGGFRNKGFGPELAIGNLLGDHYDEPVLLVKVSFGGNSLGGNFRPPSSGGQLGDKYPLVVKAMKEALEHIADIVPGYDKKQGYQLVGFFWNQGISDMNDKFSAEYETNLVNLIKDIRKDLNAPGLKTVVAVTGNYGWDLADVLKYQKTQEKKDQVAGWYKKVIAAQWAVSKLPEFKGTVATAETRDFWRPQEQYGGGKQGWHWNTNGESYWLIGEAMGKTMLKLLNANTPQAKAEAPAGKIVVTPAAYPGTKSLFADKFDMYTDGGNRIVVPRTEAKGRPWVWRARFWGHEPQFDVAMLNKGYHVVYCNVGGLLGNPEAVKRWNDYYAILTGKLGFARKPILEGMSRGGLIIYNWAAANPDKVAAIYGDAPVMDLKSWPGFKSGLIRRAYPFKDEAEFKAYKGNPVDNLKPLAEAGIPILHVVGDADTTVPVAENTAIAEKRYKAMGGVFEVIHKKDCGHHPHSLKDPTPIVNFMDKHAK